MNLTLVETFYIHIIMVIMGFMVIIKVKMPSEKPLMEKNLFLFILFSTFRIVSSFNILCQEDIRHLCKMASCTLRGKKLRCITST